MSRSLRLGCLLNAEYPAVELVRLGQLAESLGYAQLWYTDVRLFRECFVGLTALAMSTRRIALGPGVADPYSRHPAVTASTMATFDELAGGRALLGLGVGGTGFRELGISTRLPVAALRETVDVVRRLLAGERVTVEGKVVALHEGRLQFTPVRKSMPIYFATHGAQVMRLAGEVADGVLLANTLVPSALEFYLEQLRAGRAKTGRTLDDLDVCLRPEICLDVDEGAARLVMRRRVAARLIAGYPHWEFLERLDVRLPDSFTAIAAAKDTSRLDEAAASLPDAALDRTVLAGRPERAAEQLAAILRPEVQSITIRPHALPGKDVGEVLRAFVDQVVPRLGVTVAQA